MRFIPLLILFLLLGAGVPVGFALGFAGLVGLWMLAGLDTVIGIVSTSPFRTVAHFTLSTIPLYILMAEFVIVARLASPLFNAVHMWTGRVPGGVAIASVFSSAVFGACSGSSTAAAATMSGLAHPEMKRLGYSDALSGGSIAVAGTLAIMIPPSIAMVIYGSATETSIGDLFLAGILPGAMTALLMSLVIYGWVKVSPQGQPIKYSLSEKMKGTMKAWPVILLGFVIVGSLYSGIATPSELGAVGALIALIIGLSMRRLGIQDIIAASLSALGTTAMIFAIIIGAVTFGYYLTISQITQDLTSFVLSLEVNRYMILFFVAILYIALGMILDNIAILILTLPLTFPVVMGLGFDPVWFGVFCTFLGEVGLVTPPVGLNVFVTSTVGKIPLGEVFKGAAVMMVVLLISAVLIVVFPEIATYIPNSAK